MLKNLAFQVFAKKTWHLPVRQLALKLES